MPMANPAKTSVRSCPQSPTNAAGPGWPLGKLHSGSDESREQTNPFAVKVASYEDARSNPTVLVADSTDSSKRISAAGGG